jgi:Ca2+-transporting ATPase
MEGPVFRHLSHEEMIAIIPRLQVLARSSPRDKQILVMKLKEMGETVAVTGDGTNDAPALKGSDVGFSMGIAGTEVAKEASDIVLMDDNFASLVKAVMWGRSVYDSVRKFLQFQLTVNVAAVTLTIFSSIVSTFYQPNYNGNYPPGVTETNQPYVETGAAVLKAVQLLWVNLIMDTFAALALATEPPTLELLNRPPHKKSDPLIDIDMWRSIIGQAIYQIIVCLTLYFIGPRLFFPNGIYTIDQQYQMNAIIFNTFVWAQLFNEFNARILGKKLNVFKGLFNNHIFVGIWIMTAIVQVIIIQFGGVAFKTGPNNIEQWITAIFLGMGSLLVGILVKVFPDVSFKKKKNKELKEFSHLELLHNPNAPPPSPQIVSKFPQLFDSTESLRNSFDSSFVERDFWKTTVKDVVKKVEVINAFRRKNRDVTGRDRTSFGKDRK